MKVIVFGVIPNHFDGQPHPEPMLEALRRLRVPYDLDVLYAHLSSSEQRRPLTAFLPVPIGAIAFSLHEHGNLEAMKYWLDAAGDCYLPIPITCCTLNDVAEVV